MNGKAHVRAPAVPPDSFSTLALRSTLSRGLGTRFLSATTAVLAPPPMVESAEAATSCQKRFAGKPLLCEEERVVGQVRFVGRLLPCGKGGCARNGLQARLCSVRARKGGCARNGFWASLCCVQGGVGGCARNGFGASLCSVRGRAVGQVRFWGELVLSKD